MSRAEAIKASVIGFEVPLYSDDLRGEHHFDDPAAFERIRLGYSCAKCLARYRVYTPVCLMCGNERDIDRDLRETPEDIQAYYDEATGPGEKTVAPSMQETIAALMGSSDLEQVPLKGLRMSRKGQGR